MTTNPYTIKNLKTFRGMEGQGFNATLYRDGVKIAFVIDEGCGGCLLYEWTQGHGMNAPEYAKLAAYAATLPAETDTGMQIDGKPFVYQPDADSVVNDLVHAFQLERDLKRLLKRVTMKLPENKPGEFVTYGASFKPTPENIAWAQAQNPGVIVLNALPFPEALALYSAGGAL